MAKNRKGKFFKTKEDIWEALENQTIFKDAKLTRDDIKKISKKIKIVECCKNKTIIKQGDTSREVYLILKGSINAYCNDRFLGNRKAGEHTGEIGALFPNMKRTATNITAEESCFGKITSADFKKMATHYPSIYKPISEILAKRLDEANKKLPVKHKEPVIFIGSSTEGSAISKKIVKILKNSGFRELKEWDVNVFKPTKTTIESLEKALDDSDFAILVMTPDDIVEKRGKKGAAPRDNIIFELGMFIGGLSRDRAFFVKNGNLTFPSDFGGMNWVEVKNFKNMLVPILRELGSK